MQARAIERGSVPKYRQLIELMRSQIREGRFPAGARFPGEHDWAERCGVSRYTVREAQDELEREGYLVRRQGKGTFVRMPPMRHQAKNTSKEIGVLVPCITFSLYPGVIRGVQDMCADAGYHVIIGNYDAVPGKEKRCIGEMIAKPVAGLVICPSFNSAQSGYHQLMDAAMPFVLVDTMVDGIDADLVSTDNFHGAREAVRNLLAAGCRSIAFLSGYFSASTSRERLAGCRAALAERDLSLHPQLVREGDFSEAHGYEAARRILASRRKVDGFFVANDPIAIGVIRAVREAGRAIPEDIRICTFDEPQVTMNEHVPLIVVRQPRRDVGRKAAEALLERIEERRTGAAPAPARTIRVEAKVMAWK